MKVAIYARISTIDKGQNVDLQLNDLRAYAAARGWKIYQEYVDKGQSGVRKRGWPWIPSWRIAESAGSMPSWYGGLTVSADP